MAFFTYMFKIFVVFIVVFSFDLHTCSGIFALGLRRNRLVGKKSVP
jgi:hypothetical protein